MSEQLTPQGWLGRLEPLRAKLWSIKGWALLMLFFANGALLGVNIIRGWQQSQDDKTHDSLTLVHRLDTVETLAKTLNDKIEGGPNIKGLRDDMKNVDDRFHGVYDHLAEWRNARDKELADIRAKESADAAQAHEAEALLNQKLDSLAPYIPHPRLTRQ